MPPTRGGPDAHEVDVFPADPSNDLGALDDLLKGPQKAWRKKL